MLPSIKGPGRPAGAIPSQAAIMSRLEAMRTVARRKNYAAALAILREVYQHAPWRQFVKPAAMSLAKASGSLDFTVEVWRVLASDPVVGKEICPQVLAVARRTHEEEKNLAGALRLWDILLENEIGTDRVFASLMAISFRYYDREETKSVFMIWETLARRREPLTRANDRTGKPCAESFRNQLLAIAVQLNRERGDFATAFRIWRLLVGAGFADRGTVAGLTNVARQLMQRAGEVSDEDFNRGLSILRLLLENKLELESVSAQAMDAARYYNEERGEFGRALRIWGLLLETPEEKPKTMPQLVAMVEVWLERSETEKALAMSEFLLGQGALPQPILKRLIDGAYRCARQADPRAKAIFRLAYRQAPQSAELTEVLGALSRRKETPVSALAQETLRELAAEYHERHGSAPAPEIAANASAIYYILGDYGAAYDIATAPPVEDTRLLLARANAARKVCPKPQALALFDRAIQVEREKAEAGNTQLLASAFAGRGYVLIEQAKDEPDRKTKEGFLLEAEKSFIFAEEYEKQNDRPSPRLVAGKAYAYYLLAKAVGDSELEEYYLGQARELLCTYIRKYGADNPKIAQTAARVGGLS